MILFQKFLFLFKSKYRRKWGSIGGRRSFSYRGAQSATFYLSPSLIALISFPLMLLVILTPQSVQSVECGKHSGNSSVSVPCVNGYCDNNTNLCVCNPGWIGSECQFCHGKVKVQGDFGWISDGAGNYTANMKCTWLIEGSPGMPTKAPILIRINEFATECGWDHLYIFDGDNVHAPLLGVFSGILVQKNYNALRLPEIIAKSGYVLLHFYTDVAYNLTGFNITYQVQSCPSNDSDLTCSGNGRCLNDGKCTCDAPYTGEACNIQKCPNNCTNHGTCDMELHRCKCDDGYKGHDCSQEVQQGYWEVLSPSQESVIPHGSASHASVIYNNSLWVFGGNNLSLELKGPIPIYRFNFDNDTWENVSTKGDLHPPALYGHTCVVFEGKVYLYGGVFDGKLGTRYVTNTLWALDMQTLRWSQVSVRPDKCKRRMCGPLDLAGHSAVVINDKGNKSRHSRMVVISGHSPRFGYVNAVQEYHFGSGVWNIVTTKGYTLKGSYGHSSTWDPTTQKIYVFGGYQIWTDSTSAYLSSSLFSYDPSSHTWHLLTRGPEGRFLHAAVAYKGLYFIFGGNGHNDTTYSLGSKCFTSEVLVYDIMCETWSSVNPPDTLPTDVSRYGHTAHLFQNSFVVFGGFNGLIQNDIIQFTPASCGVFTSSQDCLESVQHGVKCQWNRVHGICEIIGAFSSKDKEKDKEREKEKEKESSVEKCFRSHSVKKAEPEICPLLSTCTNCLQQKADCVWCGNECQYAKCRDDKQKAMVHVDQCKADETYCGYHLHNCPLCVSEPTCVWTKDDRCAKEIPNHNTTSEIALTETTSREGTCDQSCSDFKTCTNCTSNNCMWCNNLNTCVDKNSYVISFPYGQCLSWSQAPNSCLSKDPHASPVSMCDEVASCDTCLALPSCGWCDFGLGTGLGRCMEGSSRGPLFVNSTGAFLNESTCSNLKKWHFTDCPLCQCNGHSSCDEKRRCIRCEDFTEGDHCERCVSGYYGYAINGGKCRPCECNGQAEICHSETGRCFCTTKGITGEDCGRCDTQNNYSGDASNSSCFYDLQIDYQFTFNLSKKEDRHYRKINFRNTPTKPDIDADFLITCSMMAKMNISYTRGNHRSGSPQTYIIKGHNCTTFRHRFLKTEYNFGNPENTTFYVYLYEFQPPLWIQISFSQSPKLDLLHFFITFSTCFLVLLLVAAVLWKVKQRYDMFRRRQRMFVEMEQMASRPFAQVYVEIGRSQMSWRFSSLRKRRKECPSPIALEPCHGNRAAVLSLLVSLPTGSQHFAPAGQSGLSVGSTLVALGNPRKVSFDPVSKTEGKNSKIRKSLPSHSLNTCI